MTKKTAIYWRKRRAQERKQYLLYRNLLRQRIYERASQDDATRRGHRD